MKTPSFLQIEPVGQCNLRCEMCPIQFRRDNPADGTPAFLKMETFQRILEEFPGVDHVHLQGLGEPMLHPQFFDMVALAASRKIRVTTNTNLTVLSPRRAQQCVTSGLESIHVSMDAASPEVYERIRRGSRFTRILRNLEFLVEAQHQAGSHLRLKMVSVVMRQNLAELPELVRLACRFEMESMFVQHLCHDFSESTLPVSYLPMREFVDDQSLLGEDPERIEASFAEARAVAEQLGLELRLPRVDCGGYSPDVPGNERCDWPSRGSYISYQGYLMPCCMISTPDRLNFGNLETSPPLALWNSKPYDEFRSRLNSSNPPEICQACSVYHGLF